MARFVLLAAALAPLLATAQEAEEGPVLELEGIDLDEAGESAAPTLTERAAALLDRTTLGGYGEHDFIAGGGEISRFRNHRYVLFVHSKITERISTATEIEFEWAGSPLKRDGILGAGEVLLEFAVVDFELFEWLVFRAGVILVPVGSFNLRHDAPTRDLADRPIAYTTVVPTTWFESGAGVHGAVPLGAQGRLSWELYVVNGLDARIYDGLGLRAARGSHFEDNNPDKAVTGRVAVSPLLGLEVGASGYTGAYDLRQSRVNLVNLDASWRLGRFELLGEAVRAFIDPGFVEGFSPASAANTRDAVPEGMSGFYLQANWHFTVPPLWALFPDDLQEATFTAVVRYEGRDTDRARVSAAGDRFRLTFGLNFRPAEAYVLKNDLQLETRGEEDASPPPHPWQSGYWDRVRLRYVASLAFLF